MSISPAYAYAYIGTMAAGTLPGALLNGIGYSLLLLRPDRDPAALRFLYDFANLTFVGTMGVFRSAKRPNGRTQAPDRDRVGRQVQARERLRDAIASRAEQELRRYSSLLSDTSRLSVSITTAPADPRAQFEAAGRPTEISLHGQE